MIGETGTTLLGGIAGVILIIRRQAIIESGRAGVVGFGLRRPWSGSVVVFGKNDVVVHVGSKAAVVWA
jgi:UDP-N-acetylmuramyl pentapeptide phosphotransferase/UDP-N-acetylglucosamine-1-phosphate transferase